MQVDFYTQEFTVCQYECDVKQHMSPGAILRRTQQISTDQCDLIGLDAALYARTHTAFLMAKLAVMFYHPIKTGDKITMITRPYAPQRAVYNRCTALYAQDGTELCAVDSRWVLVDTDTKRILRRPPDTMEMPFTAVSTPDKQLDMSLTKVPVQQIATEKAAFTRCDSNRHLNNTYYADILMDHIPLEIAVAQRPQRLAITYHNEVPMGADFALFRGAVSTGAYYFIGEKEGKKHFEATISFVEK